MQQYNAQVIHMVPLQMVKLLVRISQVGFFFLQETLIILVYQQVTQDFSPNFSEQMDGNGPFGTSCNDPELLSLELLAQYDCCILEFDVVPTCNTLLIRFVFGSEEYPEYVNSSFNDAFGFFVSGTNPVGANYNNTNVATLPDNITIVSVDNVSPFTNPAFYINNAGCTNIALDGLTTVLTR